MPTDRAPLPVLAPLLALALLCALLAAPPRAAVAQEGARAEAATAHRFVHLGPDDGLAHRAVVAFAQDSTGYLWIGTQDGLSRFDGLRMRTYRHVRGDATTLASDAVGALHVDADGTLWVGTRAGLSRFDPRTETFRSYYPASRDAASGDTNAPHDADALCGPDVAHLASGADGGVWVGTQSDGVCRLDPATGRVARVTVLPPPNASASGAAASGVSMREAHAPGAEAPERRVHALAATPGGDVWAAAYDPATGRRRTCRLDPARRACDPAAIVDGLAPMVLWSDAEGTLWALVHKRGLMRYDGRAFVLHAPFDVRGWGRGAASLPGGQTVWAGTPRDGLVAFDLARGTTRRLAPDPADPASLGGYDVKAVFVDRQGIVWVGHERGVSYWAGAGRPFRLVRRADGLSDERVNGLHEAQDGAVWIATNDGLNRLDPATGQVRVFRLPGPGGGAFWQVYEDRAGTLWVGGKRRGLWQMDRGAGRFAEGGPALDVLGVRHLGEDRAGRLWIGTSDGLYARDPATGRVRRVARGALPDGPANVVHQTPDGALWVGTDAGLAHLTLASGDADAAAGDPVGDPAVAMDARVRWWRYDAADPASLGAPVVWSMAHTPLDPGALWVGTFGGGLCRLDRGAETFRCLTTADGLPHDVVYGVMADDAGALWITTDDGLARLDLRPGDAPSERITVYGVEDGLQGDAFDLMAYHRGRSGRLYVGGPRGFNVFDPARVAPDRYAAPVAVSGVRVFDRRRPGLPRPAGDTLRLAHDQNHVAFDLAALDYVDPRAVRYRYRLAGVDDGWRTTDGRRPFGSYTGLAPGAYAFEVRATNHAGVASPHRARLRLVVTPAWWQTAWFRWGLALAGLGLVAGSVRARLAFLRRRQREQIHVQRRLAAVRERERQRLARDLHDGPMQELYRVGHDLDRLATLTPDHAGDVRATREAVGGVASVLRAVLVALRPPHLDALGLAAALRSLARQTERRHPALAVTTRLDVPDALDADAEYALYRITQEALANAAQHARAARVTVTLHAETDAAGARAAVLTVRDDGRGFAVPPRLLDLARDEHFGLVGAAERADALGGRLRVTSRPGHGTTVRAALPLARGGPEG